MKCVVTGHTSGIGKAIYQHFENKGYEVIGLSRSNGYDISMDQDKIIELSKDCDIFVNNAYSGNCQTELLLKLHDKVKSMIVVGSVAADWAHVWKTYGADKLELEKRCKELSVIDDQNIAKIFYLKLAFCENARWPNNLDSIYKTTFNEITAIIDLWLIIPKIYSVEFVLKETTEIIESVKKLK